MRSAGALVAAERDKENCLSVVVDLVFAGDIAEDQWASAVDSVAAEGHLESTGEAIAVVHSCCKE